ncbi:MAG: hypothetical protein QOC77_1365 [Thermoleophilaceae bacterium]|nr:hypothetical protein [Thermoleophilaceae bacterium]
MRGVLAAAALTAALATTTIPPVASAQTGDFAQSVTFFGGGGTRPLSAYESAVKGSGQVTVEFHGDEAAGCAAAHLCGVSGTVTWSPGSGGFLLAFGERSHGQHIESGTLAVGDDLGYGDPGTSARVRRAGDGGAPGSLCADVGSSIASSNPAPRRGTSIAFSLFETDEVLRTRCAGPLTRDVASLMPTRTISERAVRRGGAKLDFSADGEFASHGLAGTLHSNVVLHVGKGSNLLQSQQQAAPPPGTRSQRTRYLEVSYRIASVSGRVVTSVRGLADPDLCGPLDSCGLLGTLTTAPSSSTGDGSVIAFGSAKHTKRDLRRALGLAPGPVPRGVQRVGFFEWEDAGSVASDLTRAGAPACADSTPLAGGGLLDLGFSGAHATARYDGGDVTLGGDPLRTRCPGPSASDATGGLAVGTVPLAALGARRATLRLTRGTSFHANGYRGATRPDLTVVIRRTRLRDHVEVEPFFKP